MASTTLCDYQVLLSGGFTLDAATTNREHTLGFEVPSDFEFGTGARRPILVFMIEPLETTRVKLFMNERALTELRFNKSHTRPMFQPFSATTPFPEGSSIPKPVPLKFSLAQGKAEFSNVVIWYQIKRNA